MVNVSQRIAQANGHLEANHLRLQVLPFQACKVVHLIRHGQAFSNVAGEVNHAAYMDEQWFDASLSEKGWRQAEALGAHIRNIKLRPDLVVVSPLTRALQTACAAFGNTGYQSGSGVPPLMVAYLGAPGQQVEHDAISAEGAPPFIAHEMCREIYGEHPCDRRRDTAHYRTAFPAVDFSLIESESDQLWRADKRESRAEAGVRGSKFLAWLMTRPEREIAVVAHSGFLQQTMLQFADMEGVSQPLKDEAGRWFENCELRTIMLADPGQQVLHPSTTNFPGGALAASE